MSLAVENIPLPALALWRISTTLVEVNKKKEKNRRVETALNRNEEQMERRYGDGKWDARQEGKPTGASSNQFYRLAGRFIYVELQKITQ